MTAYYNEIDPGAAEWIRELIAGGHIAPGDVDERDIRDVRPSDLEGYTQCHFFAGIGGWSLALRIAGWPDDRPVWTGSAPCQPFSAAGRRGGVADERHLWPHWFHLIEKCRPETILGEQVASKDGLGWLDLVSSDLEGTGYAGAAVDLCAAGVGAPHIRQRLWFGATEGLGNTNDTGPRGRRVGRDGSDQRAIRTGGVAGRLVDTECNGQYGPGNVWTEGRHESANERGTDRLADTDGWDTGTERQQRGGEHGQQPQDGSTDRLADTDSRKRDWIAKHDWHECDRTTTERDEGNGELTGNMSTGRPGPVNGFWRDADWLYCRDGKWRPVESGVFGVADGLPEGVDPLRVDGAPPSATFPLASGVTERTGLLRGFGNAINPWAAAVFIEAWMEATCKP